MCILSVIVPVYNAEKYLIRCTDSILQQTFRDLELILVDDGSRDQSYALCKEIAARDNRVRVIHQENGGVAVARNTGLDAAKGEYITFVDSDDYLDREMYAEMQKIVTQYDCDVIMCDCIKEFENHREKYSHEIRAGFYDHAALKVEYFPNLLMMPNIEYPPTISNWLCMFRNKQHTEKALHYVPGIRYSEDLLFGAQMMRRAESFYYMKDQCYYHYDCTNIQSATHRYVPDKWNDYQKLHREIEHSFANDPEFNFAHQIDLCLLFFLYNTIGDTNGAPNLTIAQKVQKHKQILRETKVREMFSRVIVRNLPISNKLKIVTLSYKYQVGIGFWTRFYSK